MIKLSYSIMERLRTAPCQLQPQFYIDGHRDEPTMAMMKGQVFEHTLIGATRDGTVPEIRTPKTNKLSAEHISVQQLAEHWREQEWFQKDIAGHLVQQEWQCQFNDEIILEGHPDLVNPEAGEIIDIKYTETAKDDYYRGWADPASMELLQPYVYKYMAERIYKKEFTFKYYIFGKAGWVMLYEIKLPNQWKETFEIWVMQAAAQLSEAPILTKDFNTCQSCFAREICKFRATRPEIEVVWK